MRRTVVVAAVVLLGAVSVLPATAAGGANSGKAKPVLQPGQFYRPSAAGGCTLGFLYGGSDGFRYFTTAAHCVVRDPIPAVISSGETVFDSPPEQRRTDGSVFGHAVYAVNDYKIGVPRTLEHTPGADFALIRVLEDVRTSPAMCHWGGPTRQNDDVHDRPVLTRFYGYGNVVGQVRPPSSLTPPGFPQPVVAPARSGVSHGLPDRYYAYTSFASLSGDSGGPVMTADGGAVGVTNAGVAEVAADRGTAGAGTVYITRLRPVIERAEQMLGIELRLKTAPLSGADGAVGTTACPRTP